ncbi:hypothetical protein SDC9_132221 [bioreactor metagenome]|uniref:Uncharacterized protein n=1 Tax=bioreactor metagenome TaxID=1076179 RepID=A0A645D720_9ZZZZ
MKRIDYLRKVFETNTLPIMVIDPMNELEKGKEYGNRDSFCKSERRRGQDHQHLQCGRRPGTCREENAHD